MVAPCPPPRRRSCAPYGQCGCSRLAQLRVAGRRAAARSQRIPGCFPRHTTVRAALRVGLYGFRPGRSVPGRVVALTWFSNGTAHIETGLKTAEELLPRSEVRLTWVLHQKALWSANPANSLLSGKVRPAFVVILPGQSQPHIARAKPGRQAFCACRSHIGSECGQLWGPGSRAVLWGPQKERSKGTAGKCAQDECSPLRPGAPPGLIHQAAGFARGPLRAIVVSSRVPPRVQVGVRARFTAAGWAALPPWERGPRLRPHARYARALPPGCGSLLNMFIVTTHGSIFIVISIALEKMEY